MRKKRENGERDGEKERRENGDGERRGKKEEIKGDALEYNRLIENYHHSHFSRGLRAKYKRKTFILGK